MGYRINSHQFTSAAKAADYVVNNIDFHSYCQVGISKEEYAQAAWMFRNILYEEIIKLDPRQSIELAFITIEREGH